MRMTGSRAYSRSTRVPKMPAGLVELMEGMTKEVLKCNPTNVYEFCAAHMEKLVEKRDGPTEKRILTLNEKILKAQNKIKIRAQQRRLKYDKEMQTLCDIEHKGEDLPCKNIIIKGPVPHEMNLTSAEEIEIAQKPIVDENDCGNKNQSERNTEMVTLPVEIDSTNCNNNDDEKLTFEVKHNSDIANNKIIINEIDNLIHLDSSIDSENDKLCDNITITEVIQKNEENVLQDTNQITPIVSEQEIKNPEILLNLNNIQVIEHELVDSTDGKVEIINDNEKQRILSESEDKNIVIIKNDYVIKDLTFDGTVNCTNTRYEDLKNASENNLNNHYNHNVGDSVEICEKKEVFDNNSSGKEVKEQEFIRNKLMTNDDEVLIENSKQIITLDTSAESFSQSNLEQGSLNINEENKSDTNRDIQQSDLCNDLSLTSNIFFESLSDTSVSNDTRVTNNMDLETAAITIQKVFRSFLFKSKASNEEVSSIDEENKDTNEYVSPNKNTERRPLGITRMDTVLQTVNEEKSLSLSTDDSSTLSSAATIIQAHIRGFLIRNKLNSNKTTSTNSILNSEDPVTTSMENDSNQNQNNSKTILNIHIVPGGEAPLSRDESFVTSMDLSLDSSPPSSVNLHPLGYDKSEPRKQLKREDAVQSISPPSNNSGKLSEDVDSAKEVLNSDLNPEQHHSNNYVMGESNQSDSISISDQTPFAQNNPDSNLNQITEVSLEESNMKIKPKRNTLSKMNSDEMDVVTPFTLNENQQLTESNCNSKLIHSGELHDVVLPTNVSRSSTSVVRGE